MAAATPAQRYGKRQKVLPLLRRYGIVNEGDKDWVCPRMIGLSSHHLRVTK